MPIRPAPLAALAAGLSLAAPLSLAQPAPSTEPAAPPVPAAPLAPAAPSPAPSIELPAATPEGQSPAHLAADLVRYDDATRTWRASGHVVITYREYTLTGDEAVYAADTETATLRGNVALDTSRTVVRGGEDAILTFHFPDRKWTFGNAQTDLLPEGLLEPLHVSAESLAGTREAVTLRNVRITTCDPRKPGYEIMAREVVIVPNTRIVARRATVSLFGKRLLTLPAVTLPLDRREADRPPIIPVVGQSVEEGAYVKTNINYTAGSGQTGALRVDAMQKQGLGLGIVHDYTVGGAEGEVSLYGTGGLGARNRSAAIRHRQSLLGFDATVEGSLRRDSYLYLPGTTSRNLSLSLDRADGASTTQIAARLDSSRGAAYGYRNFTSSLAQGYRFSRRGAANLNLAYTRQSATETTARDLDTRLDVHHGFGAADVQLLVNRLQSFGADSPLVYRPVQRLPEILARTDTRRLGLTGAAAPPVALQFSTGRFEANGEESSRQMLEITAPVRTWTLGDTRLAVGGGARQAIYASDAAQYGYNASVRLTQPFLRNSDITLSYAVQARKGYSPFRFDRPFPYNTLTASVRLGAIRGLQFRAGTGYDFRNHLTPWRDVLGFALYQPNERIRFSTSAAVNVNGSDPGQRSNIRYVNSGLRLRLGSFRFDAEARYLPATGRFGRLLADLQTPIGSRWNLRVLAGTDAGQRYRHILVKRDLGCLEASVGYVNDTGWRQERGFRVMLRIKAFPTEDPITAGMFGQSLEVGAPDQAYGGVSGFDGTYEPYTGTESPPLRHRPLMSALAGVV